MTEEPWSFGELGPADAGPLTKLFERNDVPEVTATFDPFPLDAATARAIAEEPRRDRYYGARSPSGTLLGMSMLRGWDEGYEVPSFGVFVDRGHQGRGIGAALLDRTIAEARGLGAPSVRLSVYAGHDRAERLYRSRGFAEHERRPGRHGESVVMVLDLTH